MRPVGLITATGFLQSLPHYTGDKRLVTFQCEDNPGPPEAHLHANQADNMADGSLFVTELAVECPE